MTNPSLDGRDDLSLPRTADALDDFKALEIVMRRAVSLCDAGEPDTAWQLLRDFMEGPSECGRHGETLAPGELCSVCRDEIESIR